MGKLFDVKTTPEYKLIPFLVPHAALLNKQVKQGLIITIKGNANLAGFIKKIDNFQSCPPLVSTMCYWQGQHLPD